MKTLKIFSFVALLMVSTASFAQSKTETIPVSGNCGMCKSKIEKAAKTAGAADAKWDVDAKTLTVKYNSSTTNAAKIQTAVAAVGYDTRDVKATNEAYNKLHGCCQYDRTAASGDDAKMPALKTGSDGDCCKDGKCSKEDHDGKDCCKKTDAQMDCCQDGKCTKPGHDGKECCKASHSH
ncbi:heavy-metal-associated domain-containing protein [Terrimonas alba]|uniref:heavy-metal-associated domain-containing protein n=1 Tax=Terrimonas alba TaxID=3349636 RepID=UPI0035F2F601